MPAGPDETSSTLERAPDPRAQDRQELRLEPGMGLDPATIAWRRVRQGHPRAGQRPPVAHRLGQIGAETPVEIEADREAAHQELEADHPQVGAYPPVPQGGALRTRRQVTAPATPRIAETHRQDGDAGGIVEAFPVDAEPFPEPIATRIVEGYPASVDRQSGRLSDDENAGIRMDLHHRSRPQRQPVGAQPAAADLG